MNKKTANTINSSDRLTGQISLSTAKNLPFHLFLLNYGADNNNQNEFRLHHNERQRVSKCQKKNKTNNSHFFKCAIKINDKKSAKQNKKQQTSLNQKYTPKSRGYIQNYSHRKQILGHSLNENKQLKQQVTKQNAMVIGLEEFENKRLKINIMKKIFQKSNLQISNESSHSINLSSSYLLPIEQKKSEIIEQNLTSRRISQQDYLKLQQIMNYHETQKERINNFISLPVSPKKQKISKNQSEVMTKIFENNLKNGLSSKKSRFIGKMNNICIQIKNKQAKLNNYFQQIGKKFSISKNTNMFQEQVSQRKMNNQNLINNKMKNIISKDNNQQMNLKDQKYKLDIQTQEDTKNYNNVPPSFLNTLNYFYNMQRKTDNSNCKKERKKRRQVYSSNTSRRNLNQFSDQKVFILNNNLPESQKTNRQPLLNKTSKIQSKLMCCDG